MSAIPVCKHDKTHPCEFCLEERIADLERQLAEAQRCDECADSPEDIRLPAGYRCYFCDQRFCGPHAKLHFKGDRTSAALAEAQRLLERLAEGEPLGDSHHGATCSACGVASDDLPFPHKADCPWAEARAFLANIPETAAREAVLEQELTKQRDHWRAALVAWKDNETIDIDYSSALRMESDLTRFLADTSPAAAALLARGERVEAVHEYAEKYEREHIYGAEILTILNEEGEPE